MKNLENTQNSKIKYIKTYSNVLITSKISLRQFSLFSLFLLSFLLIAFEFVAINNFQETQIIKNNITLYSGISIMMFQLFNIRMQFLFIKWEVNKTENIRIIFLILHSIAGLALVLLAVNNILASTTATLIYFAIICFLIVIDMMIYFIFRKKFINQFKKIILLEICALIINALIFEIFIFDPNLNNNQNTINDFFDRNNLTLVAILVETTIGYSIINKIMESKNRFYFAKYNNSIYGLMEVAHPLAILGCFGYIWLDEFKNFTFSISLILAITFFISCLIISIIIVISALKNLGHELRVNLFFAVLLLIGALICALSILEIGLDFVKNGLVYLIVTASLIVFCLVTSLCSYMAQTVEKRHSFFSIIVGFIGKSFSFILILQFLGWEYYILEFFAPLDIIIIAIWIIWALLQFLYFINKYITILAKEKQKWL